MQQWPKEMWDVSQLYRKRDFRDNVVLWLSRNQDPQRILNLEKQKNTWGNGCHLQQVWLLSANFLYNLFRVKHQDNDLGLKFLISAQHEIFNYRKKMDLKKLIELSIDFIWENEELKGFHSPKKHSRVWDDPKTPKLWKKSAQYRQEGKSSVLSTCPFWVYQEINLAEVDEGEGGVVPTAGWYFWCQAGFGNSFLPFPVDFKTCRLSAHAQRLLNPQAKTE